ncbi:MAG: GNAT family N-acetyltransferase [Smithellaceae bacterium]|jgi:hypothetical protein|nr:hypothetical protein [Syntrophaceae bacterium]
MKVKPIPINWHPDLPIFAMESFLKAVGDDYGWLGGHDENTGTLRCILPYTIIRKTIFRMARFRVETIEVDQPLSIEDEKIFLNNCVKYFSSLGVHLIIPATTNTIFRTYPDKADAAPYGSYIIDLTQPEDNIWKNIDRIMRQNIKTAIKKEVTIRDGSEDIQSAHNLIVETFKRSELPFMGYEEFYRFVKGLGKYGKILIADCDGIPQSYAVFGYSDYRAYAIYAGNIENQQSGANKLLYWEAIKLFKSMGVRSYDFVGARIRPEKGSKQESINALKRRFGAELKEGFIWKHSINPLMFKLYNLAAKWRSGGDIVDAERHKLQTTTEEH